MVWSSFTATFLGALQSVALCQASYSLATQVFRTSDYSTASGESTNDLRWLESYDVSLAYFSDIIDGRVGSN